MNPLVAILMGTKNGERFIIDQLKSLENQTHKNWILIASDDGSSDETLEILKTYQEKWAAGKLIIRLGPQKGYCVNFLSLACDPDIKANYYAFCDQDDVWLPEKLTSALNNIAKNEQKGTPYIYCGRTIYVNKNLKIIGCSPLFVYPRTFRNALIQCIAGGNTMVFNGEVKNILEKVGIVEHPSHDWWLYQLITGVGGIVFYDPVAQVLYRQHINSVVGGNYTILSSFKRLVMLFQGRFYRWSCVNIAILSDIKSILTHGNIETLEIFIIMRGAKLKDRFRLMEVAGLYRQTWRGTISLLIAAIFKKI